MGHARTLGIIFACLLCVRVAADDGTPRLEVEASAPAHGFDPLAPLFNVHQWTAVQSAVAQFGKEHPNARVQLLKSIAPTGTDGTGERLLYSVNLIVVESGRMLYSFVPLAAPQFDPQRTDLPFYMDDFGVDAGCPLELRDVTGDRVPEIIFHSGWMGVSDRKTDIHVLQYTAAGPTQFRNIRGDQFFESRWWRFRWLDLDGRTVAIVAEPVERSDEPGVGCHACPKFHRYRVYRWDQEKASFVLSETIPSTGKLHDEHEDPLRTDWAYIVAKLKKR